MKFLLKAYLKQLARWALFKFNFKVGFNLIFALISNEGIWKVICRFKAAKLAVKQHYFTGIKLWRAKARLHHMGLSLKCPIPHTIHPRTRQAALDQRKSYRVQARKVIF